MSKVVCVTGGSGCIGSWLVHLLLHRGYTVHATVQNLNDDNETKHLQALEGAQTNLRLFQIDLLNYDTVLAAVHGCDGVFHLASPCIVDKVLDPQKELLDPAIKGTVNVLTAAKEVGVKRVVVTSSISAIIPSPNWPSDAVKREDCWTDIEYCKQKELWYPMSKTLAEKAAWDFSKENGLDVVVVNPGTVMGPVIPPRINASMLMLVRLLQGCTETYEDFFMGLVHFKDVALAHILVYENKEATGRHVCVEAITHYGDFADTTRYTTWTVESKGWIKEAHGFGFGIHSNGANYKGCCRKPEEQRTHFMNGVTVIWNPTHQSIDYILMMGL